MKINAVKFKDKASFEKNKTKWNVLKVLEPFGIVVFEDKQEVAVDTMKVAQSNQVDASLKEIPTGLAICIAVDNDRVLDYFNQTNVKVLEIFKLTNTFFVELPEFVTFQEFYKTTMTSGLFLSVEPDYAAEMDKNNDAYTYNQQWHLPNLKASEAWSLLQDGEVKDVAVLDIACDTSHEDLQGALNLSWNCVTDTSDVNPISPYEKHGTPCTGLIAARTNNNIGVSSVGANKLRVQFLHIGFNSNSGGSFMTSDTIVTRAINKAIENPNCVAISMSWGGSNNYALFSNALNAAKTVARGGKGIPIFASSGNQNNPNFTQNPASYPMVNAIGASTSTNVRAVFSNYGTKLFASTPGTSLPTTDRTGVDGYSTTNYTNFSGTSASCPVMAAIAGLILVKNPNLTQAQVLEVIKNSCRKTGGYVYDSNGKSFELGYGVPDLFSAITIASNTNPGEPTPPPTPTNNVFGIVSTTSTAEQGLPITVSYTAIVEKVVTSDLVVPISLTFIRPDGAKSVFYNGNVIIRANTNTTQMHLNWTVPNNVTGMCQIALTLDTSQSILETNENDNVALTNIQITPAIVPTTPIDGEIIITGYTWLDATRVKIGYRFTNRGTTTITSWKANVGFQGRGTNTWNRADVLAPGKSMSGGTVWYTNNMGTLPNTFKIEVVQVNGTIDGNLSNNVATILVTNP